MGRILLGLFLFLPFGSAFPFEGNGNLEGEERKLRVQALAPRSRLKGMETSGSGLKQTTVSPCDARSRLKGMETSMGAPN